MTNYQGILDLILSESSITDILGVYYNVAVSPPTATAFPLAVVGTIAEDQQDLPAISIRNSNNLPTTDFGISDNILQIHCYGANEPDSLDVAQAVYDYFRNTIGGVDGFASKFEANILTTTPGEKSTITIVELRTTYR